MRPADQSVCWRSAADVKIAISATGRLEVSYGQIDSVYLRGVRHRATTQDTTSTFTLIDATKNA
ncbi:hypothetical protein [Paraburkholderia fungorum]|uniref:Uncharacterized protein n=1 Tax=Paraburkholderia fungorum TaxID=134537 RepID=A0A420FS34_9BURK|nr:hypothetical protein [Paraburkholderia fungorum]RKF35738.1 hypothetical protein BCY88_08855 [Paraburkholderia fungorum]